MTRPNRTEPHTPNARAREGRKDWGPAFLAALRCSTVAGACMAAGVARRTVYDRRAADKTFADAWDEALEAGVEELEAEAIRRAMESSDRLLMFLLRARKPEKYSEHYRVRHSFTEAPPDILDIHDPEVRKASRDFLSTVNHARQRRLAKEGKLSLTPEQVDEQHERFKATWDG